MLICFCTWGAPKLLSIVADASHADIFNVFAKAYRSHDLLPGFFDICLLIKHGIPTPRKKGNCLEVSNASEIGDCQITMMTTY